MAKTELLQYDIRHDQKEKDINFLAKQLETHLKERFNVLLSTVEYGIKNGHLVRLGTEEPFIESIKRGRDVIQKIDLREVDIKRENAEPVGFEKIDSFLSDPSTSLNSKMLSISPKGDEGSKYQHNFYDIFTLKEKNGERCVELSRYSSGLDRKDYAKRLNLDCDNPPEAEEFLANPIKFNSLISPEKIHEALHVNHDFMTVSDFNEIWMSAFVQAYVKRYQVNRDARSFNAVLNSFDEVWVNTKNKTKEHKCFSDYTPSYKEIRFMEEKKVRQAGGQCPGKSGADIDNSPFSVFDFANLSQDKYGERTFECPECGKTNVRPENELIKNCQHCGSSKVAC
jgi:hypothetical protein